MRHETKFVEDDDIDTYLEDLEVDAIPNRPKSVLGDVRLMRGSGNGQGTPVVLSRRARLTDGGGDGGGGFIVFAVLPPGSPAGVRDVILPDGRVVLGDPACVCPSHALSSIVLGRIDYRSAHAMLNARIGVVVPGTRRGGLLTSEQHCARSKRVAAFAAAGAGYKRI